MLVRAHTDRRLIRSNGVPRLANVAFTSALAMSIVGADRALAQACALSRVSVDANGAEILGQSALLCMCPEGRFVAFQTRVQLVPSDINQHIDIYLRDVQLGTLELISVSPGGVAGNADSGIGLCDVSADGRFVAFISEAANLTTIPLGPGPHVFVRDRQLGQTMLASVGTGGVIALSDSFSSISADGRYVVFSTSTSLSAADNDVDWDVYVRDLQLAKTKLISVTPAGVSGNGASGLNFVDISSDGRFVVFDSLSSDLVSGDANDSWDVFRRDVLTGTTQLVSVASNGAQGDDGSGVPRCSEDGRLVAFGSPADNLVSGDTNLLDDVFVRDMVAGTTERVSVASNGVQGNGDSGWPAISPDGRFVAFWSAASNLVAGDTNGLTDVFLHDRLTGRTERISMTSWGAEPMGHSTCPVIARDAEVIAFNAQDALITIDGNNTWDVYERRCTLPSSYCTPKVNSQGCTPSISTTGIPMASWPQNFDIAAAQVLNQKSGMLLYSTSGQAANPFAGGTLCVRQPVRRTPVQNSGGSTSGLDCTGSFSIGFNSWIATGFDPALVAGTSVWSQYWSRDPGFLPPLNASLTDATTFVIWP